MMDDATADHVNAMLKHATQLHKRAVAVIETGEGDPVPRIHEAIAKLDNVLLLATDAASYLHDEKGEMDQVINSVHEQKAMLKVALMQIEAQQAASPWSQPWPWLSLIFILITLLTIFG
jgi:Ni2+-binding GTPase involved in maturation of urease and hydrogenase